jgi:transcriptional antiterminator Rof (Rho-off)
MSSHDQSQAPKAEAETEQAQERPYQPISCSGHDQLLALATLRKQCRLTVDTENGGTTDIRGIIEDVYTRRGAEYLRLRDGSVFRLDHIQALDGRPLPAI